VRRPCGRDGAGPVPGSGGSRDAAIEGSVRSPLPCRCFGLPLAPSEASGVGSRCSTSSARFGPCPPLLRLSGCCEPPLTPRLLVGVFSSVTGPGGEEDAGPAVRCADVRGPYDLPARVVPQVGQGAEYGAKCPHSRLGWAVSQTPRAGFQVASGSG
jgi:hypothetical protein